MADTEEKVKSADPASRQMVEKAQAENISTIWFAELRAYIHNFL